MDANRDFKGVWIPKEIWLDNRLNALEKCVFVEIDSLDSDDRGCFASNKYLAEFCGCSETKVSNAISKLISLGYVYTKSFDGRTRELKSRLTKTVNQPYKICKADLQNLQDNNIDNNIDNNKDNSYTAEIAEIIDYLNSVTGCSYRKANKTSNSHIRARLKEGFTVEDFKTVIDKKNAEWGGDSKMAQYLRPQTLFGTKFESYLNQPINRRTAQISKPNGALDDYERLSSLFDEEE